MVGWPLLSVQDIDYLLIMPGEQTKMDKITSLCKRRGFVFQGSEIYGGLAGTWDYGPLGVELKNNIKNMWWRRFVHERDDMYGVDAAILMNAKVWEASGHVSGFSDPLVECNNCHSKYREDHLWPPGMAFSSVVSPKSIALANFIVCPSCGKKDWEVPRPFNMMFRAHVGVSEDESSVSYLRPETAQGMFVNFKNVVDSLHPKLPFGLAQIGKAFRNEIAPRDFLFRAREFEQMEIEYFVRPEAWEEHFNSWVSEMRRWMGDIGLESSKIHELAVPEGDRAHYSKKTIDFEYEFPFGTKELYGIAYRGDFDLKNHSEQSGVQLTYEDGTGGGRFLPHVIEPTFGVDRTILAVLVSAYTEDEMGGEKRIFLKLPTPLAPVKIAVFPLLRNKPELVEKARVVYQSLKKDVPHCVFDDNGNIGKRYRRQDEIGTPYCVTVDFETLEDETVTLRDRDTGTQQRVPIKELGGYVSTRVV